MSGRTYPSDGSLETLGVSFMRMVEDAFNMGEPHAISPRAAKVLQQIEDWKES